MKKITLCMLCIAIMCFNNHLFSQWNVGGNALPVGGGALGSNNNRPVIFETNNIERARLLNTSGFWGFGLVAPTAQVHINATAAGTNPLQVDVVGVARMIVATDGQVGIGTTIPDSRLHINSAAGENGLRVQVAGLTKLFVDDAGGVSIGSSSTPPANGLFVSGNTGIGTTLPDVKLHVVGGADAEPGSGGYIVTGSVTGANVAIDENEIMARSNGVASALFLNNDGGNLIINGSNVSGNLGFGTSSPAVDAHIFHGVGSGATNGLRLQNEGANAEDWTFYVQNSNGFLELYADGVFMGSFNDATGVYTASDRRLKKDFENPGNVLPKVMQLEVQKYNMINGKPAQYKQYGLIAQDVEKIFPEFVNHSNLDDGSDRYTMNYSNFGVIAIKAIQEQQKTIATLEERIAKLEKALNAVSSDNMKNGSNTIGDMLEQNQPNPFNQTTIIRYKISSGANAQINVYNASGAIVKTMRATENGQVQINAGELNAGTYTYTLIIDGKQIASKKMIMLK